MQAVIGFTPDQATLTPAGRAELDRLAAALPAGTAVDVYGYVYENAPGSRFTLDTKRALAVAAHLRSRGVPVGAVQGLGKRQRGVVVAWMQPAAPAPAEDGTR